jgi:hypothetical protein
MKLFFSILTSLWLAGCANSSGVLKVGPSSYTISTSASPGKGGVPAAKRIAYEEAATACSQQGLELLALSEKSKSPTWTEGMAMMELNFRCLRKDDPEFQRQRLQSSPDEVIENRHR